MNISTLPAPLLLEVKTEHFVDVMLCLQAAGFSVMARPDLPNRHIVSDDLPPEAIDAA